MAANREKPQVVLGLLDRMYASKLDPNTVVLTTAINALAREGGMLSCLYVLIKTLYRIFIHMLCIPFY